MNANVVRSLHRAGARVLRTTAAPRRQERRTVAEWERMAADGLGVGSVVTAPPPDPYASVHVRQPEPSDTPGYDPFGKPPDGYAIARANQKKGQNR